MNGMQFHRFLLALACLAVPSVSTQAEKPDAFLDKPVVFATYPADGTELPSYSDHINRLSKAIGKPIVLPDGTLAFADAASKWKIGSGFCTWGGLGPETYPTTRKLLDMDCHSLGMKWRYDPRRDAIKLDFAWRFNAPLPLLKLRAALLNPTVLDGSSFCLTSSGSTTVKAVPDPIYILDALLSKPENFRKAWQVRFAEDLKMTFFASKCDNLLAGKMNDQTGLEHVLVLNEQPFDPNPGEGTMTYYVFDQNGRFEQGGIFAGGWRCHNASAWMETGNLRLTIRTFINFRDQIDQHFVLTDKGLILHDAVDGSGKPIPDYWDYDFGTSAFHIAN